MISETDINNYHKLVIKLFENISSKDLLASILKDSLDKLTDSFLSYLEETIPILLSNANSDEKYHIAQDLVELGNAFCEFPDSNRRLYIEIAIVCYQNALTFVTQDQFPIDWAMTQNNLAIAYQNRIAGEHRDNLEQAIAFYYNALIVRTPDQFPIEWARTQNNLANAYQNRIAGDRRDNLERAIACYYNALIVRTPDQFPIDWASTQNNLANAYQNRIAGDRRDNLERAIACYQNALIVLTQDQFPIEWATIQNNLANAYRDRIEGEHSSNLEKAILAYQNALIVRTQDQFPIDWAMTQNNLANAYRDRNEGWRSSNLEMAIACFQNALTVYTKDQFPIDWARTQNNLALAYEDRIEGERYSNLEQAIACFQNALTVRTPTQLPIECLRTATNLGDLAFTQGNWTLAFQSYSTAIEAVEQSRGWAVTQQERQRILEESLEVFANLIQTCINLNDLPTAIQYVEKSRSQKLVDLIATNDLYPDGQIPELVQEFLDLLNQINQLRSHNLSSPDERSLAITNRNFSTLESDKQRIETLQKKLYQLWNQIRRLNPEIAANLKNSAPDLATIQQLIPNSNTAILSFYTTQYDTYIFIVRQNSIDYHATQTPEQDDLQEWIYDNWLIPYVENHTEWIKQMPNFLHTLSSKLRLPELINQHLTDITELIIIPHLYLHFIPLSSLPINPDPYSHQLGEVLLDKFVIRYIHSCQVLQFCQARPPIETTIYGTIENATDDLLASKLEGEYIAQIYNIPPQNRLIGKNNATIDKYQQLLARVNVMLSSHHARYDITNPLQSILLLGDGAITLSEILLSQYPHLDEIILNNCESGMAKITSLTDDPLSLAFGFLKAGARTVVSTLWSVDDLASAILSIRYHQHKKTMRKPEALRLAQQEIRTMTKTKLAEILPNFLTEYRNLVQLEIEKHDQKRRELYSTYKQTSGAEKKKIWEEIQKISMLKISMLKGYDRIEPDELLFAAPFYWSGFIYFGLG